MLLAVSLSSIALVLFSASPLFACLASYHCTPSPCFSNTRKIRTAIGDYPARPWSLFADDSFLKTEKKKKNKKKKTSSSFFGRREMSSQYDGSAEEELSSPAKRRRADPASTTPIRSSPPLSSRSSRSPDDHKSGTAEANDDDDPLSEPVPRLVHAEALDLLGQLLTVDHTLRPSALEAMNHPYFDPVRRRLKKKAL